jgi:hypothetical protein
VKLAKFKICFMALALLPLLGVSQDVSDRGQLRYNQVQQKASHNSYQRKDDILVQLKDFNIRCIEFDIHSKPSAPSDDWWVYHTKKGDAKVCRTLSECFSKVVEFHKSEPEHEVITIFFDVAGMGAKAHSKTDFYKQVLQFFPQNLIVKPSDLLAACPAAKNLQQSVTLAGCGWPMLKDLRGKFMFVISDGKADFRKAGYDPKSDLVFLVSDSVAPEKLNAQSDVVFFNMSGANPFAKTAREAGFVSRVYWLDQKKYQEAVALGANLLATDDLDPKEFPWTSTTQPDGFPFNIIKQ